MKYEHIVYTYREDSKCMLRIDRIFEGGKRMFMCEFEINAFAVEESEIWDEFEKLSSLLGRSICIDCPELRLTMGLNE